MSKGNSNKTSTQRTFFFLLPLFPLLRCCAVPLFHCPRFRCFRSFGIPQFCCFRSSAVSLFRCSALSAVPLFRGFAVSAVPLFGGSAIPHSTCHWRFFVFYQNTMFFDEMGFDVFVTNPFSVSILQKGKPQPYATNRTTEASPVNNDDSSISYETTYTHMGITRYSSISHEST